jgi:MFS family permease
MDARRSGVGVAMAAILVQAPRLVLGVLAADHQVIGGAWQRGLLVVAGIGTATVLTGGNLYLAHAIACVRRRRRWLTLVWLLVLASTGGLVVPVIAAGLAGRTLPELLDSAALAWTWSGLAALAHEVTAAGCMLAAAALGSEAAAAEQQRRQQQQQERAVAELLAQREAARGELAALPQQRRQQRQERALLLARSGSRSSRGLRPAAGTAAAAPAAAAELVTCREGCGKQFGSALAEIGHLRHCSSRLERLRRMSAAEASARVG